MSLKSFLPLLVTLSHLLLIVQPSLGDENVFDITKFGAKPDGDATEGLLAAWKEACESPTPSKLLIPKGTYTLRAVKLLGQCKAKIEIEILGNFKAPEDTAQFKGEDTWFKVESVDGLTITAPKGAGVFDGQGQMAWKQKSCTKSGQCSNLPYNMRFDFVTNAKITGITSLNSKLFHMQIEGCKNFTLDGVNITAPKDSPNTDGIHIGRSEGVSIVGVNIGTGDDCISIKDGTRILNIENVVCDPGHGISVGSLGKFPNEMPVEKVTVKGCTIRNANTGVRIKTWLNSYESSVTCLQFEDITVENVSFPIVIDQEYCPYAHCQAQSPSPSPSNVKINDVIFKNIRGTSSRKEAVKIICSSKMPCEKVQLIDVDLAYNGQDGPAAFQCKNVKPETSGKQNPPACNAPPTPTGEEL